jgi:hypothetical protein
MGLLETYHGDWRLKVLSWCSDYYSIAFVALINTGIDPRSIKIHQELNEKWEVWGEHTFQSSWRDRVLSGCPNYYSIVFVVSNNVGIDTRNIKIYQELGGRQNNLRWAGEKNLMSQLWFRGIPEGTDSGFGHYQGRWSSKIRWQLADLAWRQV